MTKMKDSGIDWIGEIPEEWEIGSLKHYFDVQLGKMLQPNKISSMDVEIDYLKAINVQWDSVQVDGLSKMWCSPDETSKYEIINGDLVVCEGGEVGRCGIIKDLQSRAIIQNALHRVRSTNKADVKFLNYYIQHTTMSKWFEILCNKATIAHLTSEKLLNTLVVLPSLSEQIKIADYLDKKVAQLDKVKALLEAQIATLQDYRQSLIYETVTKGLDKTAPLKDSGVDWIGEIPEGWGVKRLKYSFETIGSGTTPDSSKSDYYDGEINWLQSGDLYKTDYVETVSKTITTLGYRSSVSLKIYEAPFIALAMYGASIGNLAISKIDACVNQAVVVLKDDEQLVRFTKYALECSKEELIFAAQGGTQPNINQVLIKNWQIPIPCAEELKNIADFLDKKTAQINQMIAIKQEQIDNINQQRQTLIYDVVTGKRRV